jgi:ABC-type glycerol-3-phosphate transport system permease component
MATARIPAARIQTCRNLRSGPRPAFLYPLYIVIAILVLFPLSWAFLGAFKSPSEIFIYPPSFLPRSGTLENFSDVLIRGRFASYVWNTAIVATVSVILTLFFGSLAAYAISRWNFQFKDTLLIVLLGLQLIPSTVNIVPYYIMMSQLGLLNTLSGLIIIYTASNIPITIWLLKGFFDTVPHSLDEAAAIDGCSKLRTYWSVILPLSLPGLSVAGFLCFISCWSEFLVPLVIAPSRATTVVSVGLYNFFGPDGVEYNALFAATLITVAPVLIAYLFALRYIVSGLTAYAEK